MTREERRERLLSACATALVLGAIGTALVRGLDAYPEARIAAALALISVSAAPPPPPPSPKRPPTPVRLASAPKAPAPPAPRGRATPLVAPTPPLPVVAPPPVTTARNAGQGADPAAGAADAGAGQGAGGAGNGQGGSDGDGPGGMPPRQTGGRLRYTDMPAERRAAGITATVGVRYAVEVNGRVGPCLVTRSSGYPDIDATVCRLIAERFRFRPSRDRDGRRVRSWLVESHSLIVDRDPLGGEDRIERDDGL